MSLHGIIVLSAAGLGCAHAARQAGYKLGGRSLPERIVIGFVALTA